MPQKKLNLFNESFDLLKKTLDNPVVFNSFEFLMGVNKTRRILVNDYIKPWENCKILDIGCGTGDFRGIFARQCSIHRYR